MNGYSLNPIASYAGWVGNADLASSLSTNSIANYAVNNGGIGDPMSMGCGIFPGMYGGGMFGGIYGGMYQNPKVIADYNRTMATENMNLNSDLKVLNLNTQAKEKLITEAAQYKMTSHEKEEAFIVGKIQTAILKGKRSEVMPAFTELKEAIKAKLEQANNSVPATASFASALIDEKQLKAEALATYQKIAGKSIMDDLEQHGGSQFWAGAEKGILCGLGSQFTDAQMSEDIISSLQETSITPADKAKRWAGMISSGAVTTALAVAAVPLILFGLGKGTVEYGKLVKNLYTGKSFVKGAI